MVRGRQGQLFSGDWGIVESFCVRVQGGELGRIVGEQIKTLASDIRSTLATSLMNHMPASGGSWDPVKKETQWRRQNLVMATLSGATFPGVNGDFAAPAFHTDPLYFTGAYASSIVLQYHLQKNGHKGHIAIAPDPTAVLTYQGGRGVFGKIPVTLLSYLLEHGWTQPDGRYVPARPHWVPTFNMIPRMESYKQLSSMRGIQLAVRQRMGVTLGIR